MSNVVHLPMPTDSHQEVADLVEELQDRLSNVPSDDLEPGYRLLDETRDDLRQVGELLRDTFDLLDSAFDRENERYKEYYEARHPEERLKA